MMLNFKSGWVKAVTLLGFMAVTHLQAKAPAVVPFTNECECEAPGSGGKTNQNGGTVSFAWSAVQGAASYDVWYFRANDNYTSPHATVTGTSTTYTGLQTGRYVFYISTNCEGGTSEFVVLEDILID